MTALRRPCGWRNYPLIRAHRIVRPDGVPMLAFWCPWCKCEHTHGAGAEPGNGDGHRVAHCHTPDSPFIDTGYVLWEQERAA